MKRLLFYIAFALAGLVLSFFGGQLWWYLWMYHSWPGPPNLLADLLNADGESSYDAILFEMMLIVGLVLYGIWFLLKSRRVKV